MTSLNNIFTLCAEEGVNLALNGAELEISFDEDISAQLVEQLKANKQEIIAFLQDHQGTAAVQVQPIVPVLADTPQLLSYSQQRLWFISQFDDTTTQYNLPIAFKFSGKFDIKVAEEAMTLIIARHKILQTRFFTDEQGEGKQVWCPSAEFEFSEFVFSGADAAPKALIQLEQWLKQPFKLDQALLVRGCVISTGACDGYVAFNMHHLVTDGWSMGLLVKEFIECFSAISREQAPALDALKYQYVDYAVWQRAQLDVAVLEPKLFYWQRQLANLPEVHSLPTDHPRPAKQDFKGKIETIWFDEAQTAQIDAFAQQNHTTLFTLLHTVFCCVLSRYSGSSDIVVGTPVANRLLPEVESLIGFFANTIVLRLSVTDVPFTELLLQATKMHLQALAHQDVPFEMLVERLAPMRSSSFSPLFQVMIALNNTPAEELVLPDVLLQPVAKNEVAAKFDLTLNIRTQQQKLGLEFEYASSLFDVETIRNIMTSTAVLLGSVLVNKTAKVSELTYCSDAQLAWLNQHLSADSTEPLHCFSSESTNIVELIQLQAGLRRAHKALTFDGVTLNYQELSSRVNQMVHFLRSEGVASRQAVAVVMKRELELVVVMMAILRIGAYYVPLDPDYPKQRLDYMLDNSDSCWVITKQTGVQCFANQAVREINLLQDAHRLKLNQQPVDAPFVEISADDLAYVIYTSGSTGKPKGVKITHGNLLSFFYSMQSQLEHQNGCWLALTSISFDISVLEILCTLATGYHVVLAPDRRVELTAADKLKAGEHTTLEQLVHHYQVTHLQCTPSYLQAWLSNVQDPDYLQSLQTIFVGGEAFPLALREQIAQKLDVTVWNMYGPTEATVWSSCKRIQAGNTIALGRPLSGYQFYITDGAQRVLPPGAVGELLIAGRGVSPGYYAQDSLTQSRFIANPFSSEPGLSRCYRTGDLVRLNSAGELIFCGRLDHQVKLRGFRIECGEIESCLESLPAIHRAVVKVVGDPQLQQLVAYVTLTASVADYDVNALKVMLSMYLPTHMVPEQIVVLEVFPTTSNGKIDRNALKAPSRIQGKVVVTPPVTDLEHRLAEIWQLLLKIDRADIGLESNFFDLGGHSLLLMRLTAEIRTRTGITVSIKDVFDSPTLSEQAALILSESHKSAEIDVYNKLTSTALVDGEESIVI